MSHTTPKQHKYLAQYMPGDERHLAALWASRWWWNYLAQCTHTMTRRVEELLTDRESFVLAIYAHFLSEHDRLRAAHPGSWDEDLPPLIVTANSTPGFFLWSAFEEMTGRKGFGLFCGRETNFRRAGMMWRPMCIEANFEPDPGLRSSAWGATLALQEHEFKLYPGLTWTCSMRFTWRTQFHEPYDLRDLPTGAQLNG